MLLCLDIGNSQIFGGVFVDSTVKLHFRHDSKQTISSDQLGVFLRAVLRENTISPQQISAIAICSVVPGLDYSVRSACVKYFDIEPFFLTSKAKTGLNIHYHNPSEVGTDRIATAIAASEFFANRNLIVVDLGTATTLDVVTEQRDYLGGAILPGIHLSMDALQSKTAQLSVVKIIKPKKAIGQATAESIQSGLYFGQLGMIRELAERAAKEAFGTAAYQLIGTGGFAYLFEHENLFHTIDNDLVLHGLRIAYQLNQAK